MGKTRREEKKEKRLLEKQKREARKRADLILRSIVYCPLCGRAIKFPKFRPGVIKGNVTIKCTCGIKVPVKMP